MSDDVAEQPDHAPQKQDTDDPYHRLLRQAGQWLDRMRADEPPPPGIPQALLDEAQANDPSQECDLYTLFSALTVLSGEIRLQGRAFKQLAHALTPLGDLPERLDRIENTTAQTAPTPDQTLIPPAKEVLGVLLDLSDRLERGLKTFDNLTAPAQQKSNPFSRIFGGANRQPQAREATNALRDGYALTLSRLQAATTQWGIQRIGRQGEPFDPLLMTAVEIESTDAVPEGTILEVYRSGHILHGQVLETAQVKVARAAALQPPKA